MSVTITQPWRVAPTRHIGVSQFGIDLATTYLAGTQDPGCRTLAAVAPLLALARELQMTRRSPISGPL